MAGISARGMGAANAAQDAADVDKAVIAKVEKTCGGRAGGAARRRSRRRTRRPKSIRAAGASAAGIAPGSWNLMREKGVGLRGEQHAGEGRRQDAAGRGGRDQRGAGDDAGNDGADAEGGDADVRFAASAVALALVGVPVPADAGTGAGRARARWLGDVVAGRRGAGEVACGAAGGGRPGGVEAASPGVEWGEFSLSGEGEAFRVRVIVARLDPALLEFELVKPADGKVFAGRWSVDEAPDDAVFAVNAGQFTDQPWGWLVQDGVERQAAGRGPLAPGVVVDSSGAVRLVSPDSLGAGRGSARGVPVVSDAAGG